MRLNRKESQEQTKMRLITAANELIATEGMAAASIRRISETAGHSQGAFYSNFQSKEDLLLEIMHLHIQTEVAFLRKILAEADAKNTEHSMKMLTKRLAELASNSKWSLLSIELQLHAQRNDEFAERFNKSKTECHTAFTMLVEDLIKLHRLRPAVPPRQIAIGLYALWSGLIVQGSVRGSIPRDQILLAFFKSITGCP